MYRIVLAWFLASTAFVPLTPAASAAPPAAPKSSEPFADLIHRGFRIVDVALVPAELNPSKTSTFTVTLTKDTSVAVCVTGLGAYQNIGTATWPADAKLCDVRIF